MNDELIPELRDTLCEYNVLDKPRKVLTAGEHILVGTATSTLPGLLTDNSGDQHRIGLRCLILTKLGRNLFHLGTPLCWASRLKKKKTKKKQKTFTLS